MDFGWVVLLLVFWVLSAIGEMRKKQGKKPRSRSRAKPAPDERERDRQVGPAAGRRDLARDVAEGARRAEDALRRWEARQERREAQLPRVDEQRREAYEAIADMLQGRTTETLPDVRPEPAQVERPTRRSATIRGPSLLTKGGTLETARRPVTALEEPPARATESGLDRIERLAPLQRAVVWSELLAAPVGLREDT